MSDLHTPEQINELEKLRDILYGEHSRGTQQRISNLETQLEKTDQTLKEQDQHIETALTQQITELQEETRRQMIAISERLQNEVQALNEQLEQRSTAILQQLHAAQQELNTRLENNMREIRTEMNRQDGLLHSQFVEVQAVLEANKVSRQELRQAFIELSRRLQSPQ